MANLNKGDRWYDPHSDSEFIVKEDIDTWGMSTCEMDRINVKIEWCDDDVNPQTMTVPHERFRGVRSYEPVDVGSM